MVDYKTQSIPLDIERRKQLNAELNPRKEISNEAIQTINPITGRAYLDNDNLKYELEASSTSLNDKFPLINLIEERNNFKNPFNKERPKPTNNRFIGYQFILTKDKFLFSKERSKPTSNEFIDYQFTLARMDLRDGKRHELDYISDRAKVRTLIDKMNEADIPLALISSPDGLDTALVQMEQKGQYPKYYK